MTSTLCQLIASLLLLSFGGCIVVQQPSPMPPASGALFVQNVRIFDPTSGTFSDTLDILVRGGRIEEVGTLGPHVRGTPILDADGRFALPGLWDSHAHVSFFTLGGDSSLVEAFAAFVHNGVTSVRDMGGHLDTLTSLRRRVEQGDLLGPRIFFAGPLLTQPPLTGPLNEINRFIPGSAVTVTSPVEIDTTLDRLVARGATMVKAIDNWTPGLFRHLLQAAQARSLRVVLDPGQLGKCPAAACACYVRWMHMSGE